ncbi:MAG TPA: Bax inhibitor-1/YccA family protein [Candidatus Sulfotelmatobacter sp.]|jgi:FtsH-binding integral membrane protein|nr:Bax inhibitor-1/YccA family protein [Candidatus Sulfotelmatobacter sp.]
MAFDTGRSAWGQSQAQAVSYDVGLRQYMLRVYNYMASGLALTGIVAALVANSAALQSLFFQVGPTGAVGLSGLGWLALIAPVVLVFGLSMGIARMQASTAQGLFWAYAALMGVSLAPVLLIYTGESVARVFFITAASFGSLSLWGYTTRKDLTGFGSFLMMGLVGILIASVVNIFLGSSQMQFIISVVGVLVFAGLTAYDTQKIKQMYWAGAGYESSTKTAIMGALNLYMDFINLFILLLRFFGDRRN